MKKILFSGLFIALSAMMFGQIDTAGYQTWKPLFNSMSNWEDGAFNMNQSGHPDYGWGLYNSITHGLSGDSIYLIKLQDGSFKQLFIEEKNSVGNIYTFRYAPITGENQVVEQARCVDYQSKLFLYYSLQNQAFVDREPDKSSWDMVLTKFTDTAINYTVTGFLLNEGTSVAVYHAANSSVASASTLQDTTVFKSTISAIGNSWYKLSGMSIVPVDTMVYFVKTAAGAIYKMQVNYFQSGASGKGLVGTIRRELYPTPGTDVLDTLEMGSGYANDVFFSMAQGISGTASRKSWDIAFKANAYSASIFANTTMGISLYTYPKEGSEAWTSLKVNPEAATLTRIFPNPVAGIVSFTNNSWIDNSVAGIALYNSSGQMILNRILTVGNKGITADFSSAPVGLYHVRILNDGKTSYGEVLISR
jgi:hypothetical protein